MTTLDPSTLDNLLEGVNPSDPQSLFSDAGLFGQLKKALAERMLQAELNHHLEQQRGAATTPSRNHKNGSSKKTVLTTESRLALDIPP
jgi:putative transposase